MQTQITYKGQDLLDLINDEFLEACKEYQDCLSTHMSMLRFQQPDSMIDSLDLLETYNRDLMHMMYEHIIEDIDHNFDFNPDYSWITFQAPRNMTGHDVLTHLNKLVDNDLIHNLRIYGIHDDSVITNFTITHLDCKAFTAFTHKYNNTRTSLEAFLNY